MRILILLLLLSSFSLYGQDQAEKEKVPKGKWEIGANVTSVISSFVGNSSESINPSQFPLILKYRMKSWYLRTGLGFRYQGGENRQGNFFGQIDISERSFYGKIGLEKRQHLGGKWFVYYGLDGLAFTENEKIVSFNLERVELRTTNTGIGGGPIYGFRWELTPRVVFAAEGALYFVTGLSSTREEFESNSQFNQKDDRSFSQLNLDVPQWLYLLIRF